MSRKIDFTKFPSEEKAELENHMMGMFRYGLSQYPGKPITVVAEQLLGSVAVSLMSAEMKVDDLERYA